MTALPHGRIDRTQRGENSAGVELGLKLLGEALDAPRIAPEVMTPEA